MVGLQGTIRKTRRPRARRCWEPVASIATVEVSAVWRVTRVEATPKDTVDSVAAVVDAWLVAVVVVSLVRIIH